MNSSRNSASNSKSASVVSSSDSFSPPLLPFERFCLEVRSDDPELEDPEPEDPELEDPELDDPEPDDPEPDDPEDPEDPDPDDGPDAGPSSTFLGQLLGTGK